MTDEHARQIQRMQDMIPRPESAPENTEQPGSDQWWDAHMRDKVRLWYASEPKDPHDTGALAASLRMTYGEFADWFGGGIVPERVKQAWATR